MQNIISSFFCIKCRRCLFKESFFLNLTKKLFDKTGQNMLHLITIINIIFAQNGSILIGSDLCKKKLASLNFNYQVFVFFYDFHLF